MTKQADCVIAVDVETTGVSRYDRIVSLAAIRFVAGRYDGHLYRVFDPRRDSHPEALAIHGWDDWRLRFQGLFVHDADDVAAYLNSADVLVAHNVQFDFHYIQRELRKAGREPIAKPLFCTMLEARNVWPSQSAKLNDCVRRLGVGWQSDTHDAFQDAYLAARLYFHFQGQYCPRWLENWPTPSNLQDAPPRPDGPLPRRTPKFKDEERPTKSVKPRPERFPRNEIIKKARDGLMLIRYVGVRGEVPENTQRRAVVNYAEHVARKMGRQVDADLLFVLHECAAELPGTQYGATAAAKRLAAHRDDLAAVLPIVLEMAKEDGELGDGEHSALRHIFDVVKSTEA